MPLAALAWVSRCLSDCVNDVHNINYTLPSGLERCISTLSDLTKTTLPDLGHSRPDRADLIALSRMGHPWREIAAIADDLVRAETDLEFFAFQLLEPDPGLESRLFHLSVFGSLITVLRAHGYGISWRLPLGMPGRGAHVNATGVEDSKWDIWYESGQSSAHYELRNSLYSSVVSSIGGTESSLRPDILLVNHQQRALLLECKWSSDISYVARDGYLQVAGYALDAIDRLAKEVWSFIVGPKEVIPSTNIGLEAWQSHNLVLGSLSVESISNVVSAFLKGDPKLESAPSS